MYKQYIFTSFIHPVSCRTTRVYEVVRNCKSYNGRERGVEGQSSRKLECLLFPLAQCTANSNLCQSVKLQVQVLSFNKIKSPMISNFAGNDVEEKECSLMKASSESIVDSKFIAPKKCAFYLVIHRPAPAFKASYSSHSLGHNCKSLNEEPC